MPYWGTLDEYELEAVEYLKKMIQSGKIDMDRLGTIMMVVECTLEECICGDEEEENVFCNWHHYCPHCSYTWHNAEGALNPMACRSCKKKESGIPHQICKEIFEFWKNPKKKKKYYDADEIFSICEGVLINYTYEHTDACDFCTVTYMPYDHHNEPRITQTWKFENNSWISCTDAVNDYSRTKYARR